MFKNLSIRVKISTIFTLVIFGVCIFIFTYFPAKQKNQVTSALQNKAESTLNMLAAGVTFAFEETDYELVNRLFTLVKNDSGILYIAILDEDGNQQIGYNPQKIATPVITSRSANKTFEDGGMLHTISTIDLEDGFVTLIMGFSLQDRDKQIADIRWTGFAVSIATFFACIIISIYLSKLITDPIQRVITTIKDITRTERYGDSIEKSSDDEVGALIDSFNKMGKRIQTRTSELQHSQAELNELNQQLLNNQKELSAANQQLMASFEQLKANEIALIESEEQIRLIIDSAQDAVVTMDEKGLITEWNSQAEKMFGWSRKEMIRKSLVNKILPEQFREANAKGLERHFSTGDEQALNQRLEIQALHRDGHEFQVELTITPLKVGKSTIFSGFIRDITQQKKAEKELKTAKEGAESANQELRKTNQHLEQATLLAKEMAMQAEMSSGAKSEFLANMS
ncbi:PAS domain S-box protein, partial [candidate division KSB1 bacterium]|nr:PAS domain S-box protein [candidate division KSB1 bacterium]